MGESHSDPAWRRRLLAARILGRAIILPRATRPTTRPTGLPTAAWSESIRSR